MPNSTNQRTLSTSLSGADLMKVERYITASGMSASRFIHKALLAYVQTLPDPDAAVTPPERPAPNGPEPRHYSNATEEEMQRLGISMQDYALYDMDGQDNCLFQLRWLRGYGILNRIMPKARYDGDMAYLDWAEYNVTQRNNPKALNRLKQVRAHLLTLPLPPKG